MTADRAQVDHTADVPPHEHGGTDAPECTGCRPVDHVEYTGDITVTLDRTTAMLVRMLRAVAAEVPSFPNDEQAAQHEVRAYDDWDRQVRAYRLLISTRVLDLLLGDDDE
jgi:hypothetical protein